VRGYWRVIGGLLRDVLRELLSDDGAHTRHLVQAVHTAHRRTAEASTDRLSGQGTVLVGSPFKDLAELMEFFWLSTCEA
jgi:hypothetical protein